MTEKSPLVLKKNIVNHLIYSLVLVI